MANGQTGFKPPRASVAGQQIQRTGQMGYAGPPQPPNPNAVPPPGAVDINAKNRVPPGVMRFLNPGLMPSSVYAPQGMAPGQPQLQRAAFEPGAVTPNAPVGIPDPNAVAPVGLPQFQVGMQAPPGRGPLASEGAMQGGIGMPIRRPMPLEGNFQGAPGILPQFAGGIPPGQGQIPRSLLNLAMRRTGFMPQFGQFGP